MLYRVPIWLSAAVSCLLAISASECCGADEQAGPTRWESAIREFEQLDKDQSVTPDGVLFVGSSSIRQWDLKRSFPQLDALNRGLGGSQMSDVLHYVDRIAIKYRPSVIILYEGDNDIARGKPPKQLVDEYRQLVSRVHCELPQTRIVFLSIKPSIARQKLYDRMQSANDQIEKITCGDTRLEFIDVSKVMMDMSGSIRQELFLGDGLHLNEEGYRLWSELVGPFLK